jgi:hypothetical protein
MLKAADAQILDGGDDDGIAEDDRADERAGAGERGAGFKNPVHDVGVEDEHDARDGLPQMHRRMFVVVTAAAIVVVLVIA